MTIARLESASAWMAFIAILLGSAAGYTKNFKTRVLPNNLNSPVLAMELLHNADDVPRIVGAPGEPYNNRAAMTRLMHVDFAFIPAYAVLFALVGDLLFHRGGKWRWGGMLAALLGAAAAVFDILENLAILHVLSGGQKTPRSVSLTKWTLIFMALAVLAPVYLNPALPRIRRALGFLTAGFSWLASLLGLAGVAFGLDALIETGATLMGISLVTGWLFFATHSFLACGLLAGLNRLATHRWVWHLTNWPSDE
jgi:hypothetical protein